MLIARDEEILPAHLKIHFNGRSNSGHIGLFHDSAAVLLVDGKIVAAAQEERFSRIKNDDAFPINAIFYVLEEGGIPYENLLGSPILKNPC